MDPILLITQILVATAGILLALMTITLFLKLRWPAPALWMIKLYTTALSPILVFTGLLVAAIGLITGSAFISVIGIYSFLIFGVYYIRASLPPPASSNFEHAFGNNWEARIKPEYKAGFLPHRTILRLPAVPQPSMQQDISFTTIPGSGRQLLCDIWLPPENIKPSGLALIYLHGSAFYFLDKDCGTRPLFTYLAGKGHMIMDVAYRLAPETDIMGMLHDVKRAIAYLKENAKTYHINPDRLVVGGGSAGGHLALLAAYTANDSRFTPAELEGKDLGVSAVVSMYGTSDLEAIYYHTNQHITTRTIPGQRKLKVPTKMPGWIIKKMGSDYHGLGMDKDFKNAGTLQPIMGGHPDECPEKYALLSPISHVHAGCPPTLLIHGKHDIMAPVKSTRILFSRLQEAKVPSILHLFPQTEHGYDMVFQHISPTMHNEVYDVERFLAYIASTDPARLN